MKLNINSSEIIPKFANVNGIDFNVGGKQQLAQILELLPQLAYLKDARTRQYIWCNKRFANFLHLHSQQDIVGKLAVDFVVNVEIYEPNNLALSKKLEDQAVSTRKALHIEKQIHLKCSGITTLTAAILPILDNSGVVDSLLCYGSPFMLISDKSVADVFKMINKVDIPKIINKAKYPINTTYGTVKLSRREVQCTLYMFKGLISKEIAVNMGVSNKTVEKYIESIKSKTGCNSRSEIIATVIEGDLLKYL